jgi:hypothetical protein
VQAHPLTHGADDRLVIVKPLGAPRGDFLALKPCATVRTTIPITAPLTAGFHTRAIRRLAAMKMKKPGTSTELTSHPASASTRRRDT